MDTSKTQREYNYDILRVVCCFLVVLLHFSGSYWYSVDVKSFDFRVMTIYDSMTRVGVPIFLMISGSFLLDPSRQLSTKQYLLRPLKLFGTVYLWSAFYAFPGLAVQFIKTGSLSSSKLRSSLRDFVLGHYHMWFCFLLVSYYVLLPIARKIAEDSRALSLFIVLWAVIGIALPRIFESLNLSQGTTYLEKFDFKVLNGFFGYFLLGYLIKNINIKKPIRVLSYCLGLLSVVCIVYLTIYQSIAGGKGTEKWFGPKSPFVFVASFAMFLFFKELKVSLSDRAAHILVTVSGYSFFVYMFHVFILEKLKLIGITIASFNMVISIPVLTLAAFLISVLVAFLVSKIPFVGKAFTYR